MEVECEGETIDEAIDNALRELGATRDRVEVEILADATRGVFGFGGKKARVRARVRAPIDLEAASARVSRETPRPPVAAATPPPSRPRETPPPTPRPAPTTAPEALKGRAIDVLTGILGHLGAASQVAARPGDDPGSIVLDVAGDSSGLLIGRRGATLDALEYLVNRIVSRDEVVAGRIVIDVEHYRQRRQEYLDSLARRLADKAKQTGRVVTLNPMSPRDRRIVHLSLQNDGEVTTRSQGDGYYRRVLILPAGLADRAPRPRSPRA